MWAIRNSSLPSSAYLSNEANEWEARPGSFSFEQNI